VNPEIDRLERGADTLGVPLDGKALHRFDRYLGALMLWRTRLNLIGPAGAQELVQLHLLDSLLPLAALTISPGAALVDVGSGAGLPGVPLKIARPDLRVTLVEASRRRVAFLEHLREVLELPDVAVACGRAEVLAHREAFRERSDVASERATARLDAAAELCLPFVAVGGACLLLKGPTAIERVAVARPLISDLGAIVEYSSIFPLPGTDRTRTVLVLRKRAATPSHYPRRAARLGQPPGDPLRRRGP
jgi:16S rRNA (guanine527-N7)-methyltransferase